MVSFVQLLKEIQFLFSFYVSCAISFVCHLKYPYYYYYYYYYYYTYEEFFTPALAGGIPLESLQDPLSILAGLNNAVIWMILACPTLPALLPGLWGSFPSAPNTIGITVISMFQNFIVSIILSSSIRRSTILWLVPLFNADLDIYYSCWFNLSSFVIKDSGHYIYLYSWLSSMLWFGFFV